MAFLHEKTIIDKQNRQKNRKTFNRRKKETNKNNATYEKERETQTQRLNKGQMNKTRKKSFFNQRFLIYLVKNLRKIRYVYY